MIAFASTFVPETMRRRSLAGALADDPVVPERRRSARGRAGVRRAPLRRPSTRRPAPAAQS
jgi:hypothetical protein